MFGRAADIDALFSPKGPTAREPSAGNPEKPIEVFASGDQSLNFEQNFILGRNPFLPLSGLRHPTDRTRSFGWFDR